MGRIGQIKTLTASRARVGTDNGNDPSNASHASFRGDFGRHRAGSCGSSYLPSEENGGNWRIMSVNVNISMVYGI
jgi:hypothetical protein